jgi:spermidine synthase
MAGDGKGGKWFQEINPSFWPGQAFSLEIDEILHKQRSKYQDVLVFKRLSI